MGTYGTVSKQNFNWVKGQTLLTSYQQNKSLKRLFCADCGSYIASTHDLDPLNIFILLGSLESNIDIEISYQQFVHSKASWVQLDQNIKMYNEWPEWVSEKLDKRNV